MIHSDHFIILQELTDNGQITFINENYQISLEKKSVQMEKKYFIVFCKIKKKYFFNGLVMLLLLLL